MSLNVNHTTREAEPNRPFSFFGKRIAAYALTWIVSFTSNPCRAGEPPAERVTLHPGISYAAIPGEKASVFSSGELRLGIKAGRGLRLGPVALLAFTDRNDEVRELSAGAGAFLRLGGRNLFVEGLLAYLGSTEGKSTQRLLTRCSFGTTRHATQKLVFEPQVFFQYESVYGQNGEFRILRPGIQISLRKCISKTQ